MVPTSGLSPGGLPTTQPGAALTVTLRPADPVDVRATLSSLRRGPGDPTWRDDGPALWKTWYTPDGPVTARIETSAAAGTIQTGLWGPGSAWLAEQLPDLLGLHDDVGGFRPHHPAVESAWRRFSGWRVPRTGLVIDALLPAVVEQKVTGREAFAAQRYLVRQFGTTAPGPGAELGLLVAPAAAAWARVPSWEWLRAGVDRKRSDAVMRSLAVADRLEECRDLPPDQARRRICAIPGIGGWTAAEVAQRALGDADAVSFGDYHVARNLGWALVGRPVDDAELAVLLEPYAGHRYRVQRLIELARVRVPRRGPRRALPRHLPRMA